MMNIVAKMLDFIVKTAGKLKALQNNGGAGKAKRFSDKCPEATTRGSETMLRCLPSLQCGILFMTAKKCRKKMEKFITIMLKITIRKNKKMFEICRNKSKTGKLNSLNLSPGRKNVATKVFRKFLVKTEISQDS